MTGSPHPTAAPSRKMPARASHLAWALLAVIFVGLWLWAVLRTPFSVRERVLIYVEPIGDIERGQTIGQTFLAPYNGLQRIEVSLTDFGRLNTGRVEFRLSAGPEAPIPLVSQSFPAEAIRGDVRYAFEFDPIPDSAGKNYYFELAAPDAVPGNAITAYLSPSAPYPDGTAYRSGHPHPGDLAFTVYFHVSPREQIKILLAHVTAYKPPLWNEKSLYLGLILGYLASVVGLLSVLARSEVMKGDEAKTG